MKPGQYVAIARLTLRNESALAICTGQSKGVFDTDLSTDWNDLPCLPASAITGVLRSLATVAGELGIDDLFGFQDGKKGSASRLSVSYGLLRGSDNNKNRVYETLDLAGEIQNDAKLKRAQALNRNPAYRHGVCINERGVAADKGKYDLAILPKGYEFAVELKVSSGVSKAEAERELTYLIGLMRAPNFRLGRRTRSGLGCFSLINLHLHLQCFDLATDQGQAAFKALKVDIDSVAGLTLLPLPAAKTFGATIPLTLHVGTGGIRVGSGSKTLGTDDADLIAYSEVDADGKRWIVIPGSSIRGVLRHRTLYWLYCLSHVFVDSNQADKDKVEAALNAAFGYANSRDAENPGQAGKLWFKDIYLVAPNQTGVIAQAKAKARTRNSIDRFTGGVRNRMLFTEENIYPNEPLKIEISHEKLDPTVLKALELALDDLKSGRLALGGGGTNGVGLLYETKPAWVGEAVLVPIAASPAPVNQPARPAAKTNHYQGNRNGRR